jgi:hypothetical protein
VSETVTREQAEGVLAAVKAKFPAYCMTFPVVNGRLDFDGVPVPAPDDELPRLAENYQWSDRKPAVPFAVIWEAGPDGWAMSPLGDEHVDEELTADLQEFAPGEVIRQPGVVPEPDGVFCEAIYSYALGIYPAG